MYYSKALLGHKSICQHYRTWRNIGGVKYWRIWRIAVDSPKINPPKFCFRDTRLCYNKSVVSMARLHDMVDYLLLTDEHI